MNLEALYDHLLSRAQRTHQDVRADLPGGARLAVRAAAGVITLTVARTPQRVGDVEALTFYRICRVPPFARRIPETGQATRAADGKTWHLVGWTWREEGEQGTGERG